MKRNVTLLGAVGSLALWVVLAFVAAIHSGWVHVPLAVGAVLIAKGIIDWNPSADG